MFSYDQAMAEVDTLLADARQERRSAEKYGLHTTSGDSGIPCLQLAGLLVAEAQVWATVAQASLMAQGVE